jgi:hypothetical protein
MNYKKSFLFYIAALLATVISYRLLLTFPPDLIFGFPSQKQLLIAAFQHIVDAQFQIQQHSQMHNFRVLELVQLILKLAVSTTVYMLILFYPLILLSYCLESLLLLLKQQKSRYN